MKGYKILGWLFIIFAILSFQNSKAMAASKYVSNMATNTTVKVSGVTFITKQYQSGEEYFQKIIMKNNGKKKTIVTHASSAYVTNGKILYYVKKGKRLSDWQYYNTIYQYNILTGKSKKIISGRNYTVMGCSGQYLYYGKDQEADGVQINALNINTKKKKYVVNYIGNIFVYKKKVIAVANTGDFSDVPIYSFNLDGSGKKKIADGVFFKISNSKLYYYKVKYENKILYKKYSCALDGKKTKALSGWTTKEPDWEY